MANKQDVQNIFNDIAPKYDALNHILSMNIDKIWRKKAINYIHDCKNIKLLDVACGTGDFSIAAYKKGVRDIKGIDISKNMVDIGNKKIINLGLDESIQLFEGDSEDINFPEEFFDYTTVAFGVRNFEHLEKGLTDMYRILKIGGKIIILEFSMPEKSPFKQLYKFYFRRILPIVGGWISGNKQAYTYLPNSVLQFPQGKDFLAIMNKCGYSNCVQKKLSFGIASIYIGEK